MGRAPGRFLALLALALSPCACASSAAPSVAIRNPPAPPPAPAQAPVQAPPAAGDPAGPMGFEESDQDEGSPDADDAPPGQGRGWLGVELEPAAPDEGGVRIGRVVPKSPAERAGLLAGDLIQRLDSEPVGAPAPASVWR